MYAITFCILGNVLPLPAAGIDYQLLLLLKVRSGKDKKSKPEPLLQSEGIDGFVQKYLNSDDKKGDGGYITDIYLGEFQIYFW